MQEASRVHFTAGADGKRTARCAQVERHEAIGQRGEACIIVLRNTALPSGDSEFDYTLATGERLRRTEVPGEFVTYDRSRTFKLRL